MSYLLPTYASFPITIVKGEGARLWDEQGTRYLDFCAGIATCSIGHCHPRLSSAISDQAKTLMHCSNLYLTPQSQELSRRLVEDWVSTPGAVFLANSGAEANDGMIKTARRFGHAKPQKNGQARFEIITFNNSFHGRTLGSMAATAQRKTHQGFTPLLSGFNYSPLNDLEALKSSITESTVGIMLEPIQGEGGVHRADPDFLKAITALCKKHDLLLMLDEIQCGLGRTGTHMGWQALYPELKPDTISWAKGLGGGFPIGAFYVSDRLIDTEGSKLSSLMSAGSHGSTYGGNPLACVAALAVLEEIESADLLRNVIDRERQIRDVIQTWNLPFISELRGKGLLLGFLLNPETIQTPEGSTPAGHLCKSLMSNGLLTVPAGAETLRWLPPLNVTEDEVTEALAIMKSTLYHLSV